MTDTVAKNLASHGVRWCLGTFLAMRLALTAWPALVLRVYPIEIPWQDPVGVALVVPLAYLWWRAKVPWKTWGLALLAVLMRFSRGRCTYGWGFESPCIPRLICGDAVCCSDYDRLSRAAQGVHAIDGFFVFCSSGEAER